MASPAPASTGSNGVIDDGSMSALLQRYESIKAFDAYKATYIEDIVRRLQFVSERLTEERAQFDHERKWVQEKLAIPNQKDGVLKDLMDRETYILVLIDGNDLIFRNSLLRDGDVGGRLAAQGLFQAVNEYAFSTIDDLPHDTKVIARFYVDVEDLCSVCLRAGVVNHANKIKTFVRGFCQDKALFDLVDVGMQGASVVYDKMEENLKLHIFDTHCRHILFGCADEVYRSILKPFADTSTFRDRITLLCGAPADEKLASLQLESTQMTNIFRNTKVDTHKVIDYVPEFESLPPSLDTSTDLTAISPPISTPATSRSNSRMAQETGVQSAAGHSRQVSVTSSGGSSDISKTQVKPKSKPGSWAMAAQKGASFVAIPPSKTIPVKEPVSSGTGRSGIIRRNKRGERIDPPTPEFKKDEVNRLKKLKLCNAHHLRGDCPYANDKCTHDHMYKPTKSEYETLRLVARMSACVHGSECDDPKCIYGHRCPFPEAREGSMRGKGCINGENCRFPSHMHGMDSVPVRMTKIS